MKSKTFLAVCLIVISAGVVGGRRAVPYFGKMIYELSDKVGIGTSVPDGVFEVNMGTSGQVRLSYNDSDGSAIDYAKFEVASDGALTITTVDDTAASGDIALMPDGNVGIGTTTPDARLSIRGTTPSDTPGAGAYINMGGDNPYWTFRETATAPADFAIDRFYSSAYYEAMRIERSTGKVGIGTTTPNNLLTVQGSTGATIDLETGATSVSDGVDLGTIEFRSLDTTLTHLVGAMIRAEAAGVWGGTDVDDAPTELQFFTEDNTSNDSLATPRMVIDSIGNVGIGTTAPESILEISTIDNPTLTIFENLTGTTGTKTLGIISVEGLSTTDVERTFVKIQTNSEDATNAGEDSSLFFQTMDNGTLATRMAIKLSNVGIGTATPSGSSTTGTNVLALGDGTAPVGGRDLIGLLYSNTVGATTEVFAMDEGGTAAQLTDDAEELYYDPNQGAYIPTARIKINPYAGIRQRLDLWKLAKVVEELTGESIITVENLPPEECADWDADQQIMLEEREQERLIAQGQIEALEDEISLIDLTDPNNIELIIKKNAEKAAIKVKPKYEKKPKPNWIKKVREAIGD